MSLLNQIGGLVGGALGGQGGGVKGVLIQQLIGLLNKPGALGQLTSAFQSAGLANVLQSWIGTGANLPISGDQVKQVLGAATIAQFAQKAGIGEGETSSTLADLLPQLVDKFTPDGQVPQEKDLGGLLGSLGKLLG